MQSVESKIHWTKLRANQWRDRAVFVLVISVIGLSLPDLYLFADPLSLILVFVPTLLTAEILERLYKLPFNVTLLTLAIPMGMVGSAIGLVNIFSVFNSIEVNVQTVSSATSILLLTAFFGLILCVIGHLLSKDDDSSFTIASMGIKTFISLIFVNFGFIFWIIFSSGNPIMFLSLKPLLLAFGLTASFQLSRKKEKGFSENAADASLAVIIISIMIGLIMLYSNFGSDQNYQYMHKDRFTELANYANYGLLYGCSLYIFSFLLSLYTNEFYKINFKLKNWHLVEAFSFYVFMTLAAPSLFEIV